MKDRRTFLLTTGSSAMTLATLGWKSSAPAVPPEPAGGLKTTSLMLPLEGVFVYLPPQPIGGFRGETVTLAGNVHVVTAVPPQPIGGSKVNVYLNMAGVQGTGETTGSVYIGTGSDKLSFQPVPVPPEPVGLDANFSLEPTNGLASVTMPLSFNLVFGSDGTLLPESSVSIYHVT